MQGFLLLFNDGDDVACCTSSVNSYYTVSSKIFWPFELSKDHTKICALHHGMYFAFFLGDNREIYISYSIDATIWVPMPYPHSDWRTSGTAPNVIKYKDRLIMALLGEDNGIYFSTSNDGFDWSRPQPISGTWQTPGQTPTLCVYQNQIHLMALGEHRTLDYKLLNDDLSVNHAVGPLFNGWETVDTPNLVVHKNDFLMCVLGDGGAIYLAKFTNGGWNLITDKLFGGWECYYYTPALISDGTYLYMARTDGGAKIYIARTVDYHNWEDIPMNTHWQTDSAPFFLQLLTPYLPRASTDWMSYLDDNLKVIDTHIPGSHDAGSYESTSGNPFDIFGAVTQRANFYEQLKVGSRFFDIRVKLSGGELVLHHNVITFEKFKDVIEEYFLRFARENPREVMFLDIDMDGSIAHKVVDMILKYIPAEQIATEFNDPDNIRSVTWGQLRNAGRRYVMCFNTDPFHPWMNVTWKFRESPYEDFQDLSESGILEYLGNHLPPSNNSKLWITQVVNTPANSFINHPDYLDRRWHLEANQWVKKHSLLLNVVYRDFVGKIYNIGVIRLLYLLNFLLAPQNFTVDLKYYYDKHPDVQQLGWKDITNVIEHWAKVGLKEGRRSSLQFDILFYQRFHNFPSTVVAMDNWLESGARLGARCSREFDVKFYLSYYPDLLKAFGTDYLAGNSHWLTFGINEGRRTSFVFDVSFYLSYDKNGDLESSFGARGFRAAFFHWLYFGINEGRRTSYEFDVHYYLDYYPDLKNAFKDNYAAAIDHWIWTGIREKRRSSADFDVGYYMTQYHFDDPETAIMDWLTSGRAAGRIAHDA